MSFISITADTQESMGGGGNYFQIQRDEDFILENVLMKELRYDVINDKEYFEITTVTKDGKELKSGYQFIPDKSRSNSEEAFNKAVSMRQGLLTNILRRYKGEQAVLEANSWKEAVEKINATCSPMYETTPLRVKLALNKSIKDSKYYTNISVFAPFENMTVPKEQTRHIISNRDKLDLANKNREDSVRPDPEPVKAVDSSVADSF